MFEYIFHFNGQLHTQNFLRKPSIFLVFAKFMGWSKSEYTKKEILESRLGLQILAESAIEKMTGKVEKKIVDPIIKQKSNGEAGKDNRKDSPGTKK